MIGQAEQSAPSGISPSERALEQRSAGLHSYRAATPFWYSLVLATMHHWRVGAPVELSVEGHTLEGAVAEPATLETAEAPSARDWIKKAQQSGAGIAILPRSSEPPSSAMLHVNHARDAEALTSIEPSAFVLSEPKAGWLDASFAQLAAFPVFFAVGIVAVMALREAL